MIEQFRGEHRWLSNFYPFDKPATITLKGKKYEIPTAEHWYVMEKTACEQTKILILQEPKPGEVKKLGYTLDIQPGFKQARLTVMEYIVHYKYSEHNPSLMKNLIATGDEYIQEGNRWNDTFWGYCLKTNTGDNNLGKLIMKRRERLICTHTE